MNAECVELMSVQVLKHVLQPREMVTRRILCITRGLRDLFRKKGTSSFARVQSQLGMARYGPSSFLKKLDYVCVFTTRPCVFMGSSKTGISHGCVYVPGGCRTSKNNEKKGFERRRSETVTSGADPAICRTSRRRIRPSAPGQSQRCDLTEGTYTTLASSCCLSILRAVPSQTPLGNRDGRLQRLPLSLAELDDIRTAEQHAGR